MCNVHKIIILYEAIFFFLNVIFILEKMSFSVRFNAEDEEVEGLCTTPIELQLTGILICIEILKKFYDFKVILMLQKKLYTSFSYIRVK